MSCCAACIVWWIATIGSLLVLLHAAAEINNAQTRRAIMSRPDVKTIRDLVDQGYEVTMSVYIAPLCDYILELEAEVERLRKREARLADFIGPDAIIDAGLEGT